MGVKVTNNAFGTLSAGISTSDTTVTLDSGQGARFPTLGAGDYFYGTIVDTSNNLEIVKVTARSTDSMTVTRAQDNTTATAFSIGDRFELRPVAALFEDVGLKSGGTTTGSIQFDTDTGIYGGDPTGVTDRLVSSGHDGFIITGKANDFTLQASSTQTPMELSLMGGYGNILNFYTGTAGSALSTTGTISVSASGTTYNTTSDARLKDNIETITDGTAKLMEMNPVTHTWIADPEAPAVHGFIAQEMQEIAPEAVSGTSDGDEMMSMDYGRITPILVAALQDAHKKIEALEARLAELEVG